MKLNRRTLNVLANILLIVVVGSALIWAFSGRTYDRGYNEGYDAGYSEALSPWLEVQPDIQWHSTEMFLIDDVDDYLGQVGWHPPLVWPIHHVRKPWLLDKLDSTVSFDTSRDWYRLVADTAPPGWIR